MTVIDNVLEARYSLDRICKTPDSIISVYSLDQHVWANDDRDRSIRERRTELRTIDEFQIEPVMPLLTDIFRRLSAPYRPQNRDNPIGQGWWIQADFGSGKSHLLCFVSALALGDPAAWDRLYEKEEAAKQAQLSGKALPLGARQSLSQYREGLEKKSANGGHGILVVILTLTGRAGGTVGEAATGQRLIDFILEAVQEQVHGELGKTLSLYPAEILVDHFLKNDLERYRRDLRDFLKSPHYFDENERQEPEGFLKSLHDNTPGVRRDCGNRLWQFYTEYLKTRPIIAQEAEPVLKNMVEALLDEGYAGLLLVMDEVSQFMMARSEQQRSDDEATLVVLSNRLTRAHNLPVWTLCAAQTAIESKMGAKNIIASDRLKEEHLLGEKDYYQVVLSRVRSIIDPALIDPYYLHYRRGFSGIEEAEFRQFFPFHKPALEQLRHITAHLTTARASIHFMHQTLKSAIHRKDNQLIRLWEIFDEAVHYEEDPGGGHPMRSIANQRPEDFRAFQACLSQLDNMQKGALKVHREKAFRILQTLFLFHIGRSRQQGLTPEEIANVVLIERSPDATPPENIEHYESLADNLKRELAQIEALTDNEAQTRYRFDASLLSGVVDPADLFQEARDRAAESEMLQQDAWNHLLGLDRWPVQIQRATSDFSHGVQSLFRAIAPAAGGKREDESLDVTWEGRLVQGRVGMRDLAPCLSGSLSLPPVETYSNDIDFAIHIGTKPADPAVIKKMLDRCGDPRILIWTPADFSQEERNLLLDFAAYRQMVQARQGKSTEEDVVVLNWVKDHLETSIANIVKIVDSRYRRGRIDSRDHREMEFTVAGGLQVILAPLVEKTLTAAYESRTISFPPPVVFKKEDGPKVINGLVKTGKIPLNAKSDQNVSAARNFAMGLQLVKSGDPLTLNTKGNPFVREMAKFIDERVQEGGGSMKLETLYKNFMGIASPKSYGLSRRMVQIYLLCLVKDGKIKIVPGPRSGLSVNIIDYSTIAEIDFSARILDALAELQKVEQPEHWEVLRPYAEKLLEKIIPATHDDSEIMASRSELRELFAREKAASNKLLNGCASLFGELGQANPYAGDLEALTALFATDFAGGSDIDLLLDALRRHLNYEAWSNEQASDTEVSDLAIKMAHYRSLERFVVEADRLRAAKRYLSLSIPEGSGALGEVRTVSVSLADRFADLRPYIDSEVRLKTELLGELPPTPGDRASLGALINTYRPVYTLMHDRMHDEVGKAGRAIRDLIAGEEMQALETLERITALQPAVSAELKQELEGLRSGLFRCGNPSRASVEGQLWNRPEHDCGLTFESLEPILNEAGETQAKAAARFNTVFNAKLSVFFSPSVRERLKQGVDNPLIAELLRCADLPSLRAFLTEQAQQNPGIVELINRYLKKILLKPVKLSDFKPGKSTVEAAQAAEIAQEFRRFLESHFSPDGEAEDTIIVLQLETAPD